MQQGSDLSPRYINLTGRVFGAKQRARRPLAYLGPAAHLLVSFVSAHDSLAAVLYYVILSHITRATRDYAMTAHSSFVQRAIDANIGLDLVVLHADHDIKLHGQLGRVFDRVPHGVADRERRRPGAANDDHVRMQVRRLDVQLLQGELAQRYATVLWPLSSGTRGYLEPRVELSCSHAARDRYATSTLRNNRERDVLTAISDV